MLHSQSQLRCYGWVGYVTHTEERKGACRILMSELQINKQLGRPGDNGNNIKKHVKENGMMWTGLI
jgi:hypothetical protein